jgi:hypothetical protein
MGALLGVIAVLIVLGTIAWLVQGYKPLPAPFKVVIQALILLFAIWVLLAAVGFAPGPIAGLRVHW